LLRVQLAFTFGQLSFLGGPAAGQEITVGKHDSCHFLLSIFCEGDNQSRMEAYQTQGEDSL
jgi:hypothetical protein